MTRVLHTARISNVEIIKCVVNNKDGMYAVCMQYAGRVSHINLVNGPVHHESLVAQLVRAPNRYLGGHGFDSRRGLRIFLCPMLVSCRKNPSSLMLFVSQSAKALDDFADGIKVKINFF